MPTLANILDTIGHPRILVLGDLILDKYTSGNAERVSPEAPVIVLRVDGKEVRLGGAASVALLLRGLEAEVTLAGVVGDDSDGRTLRSLLRDEQIDARLVLIDPQRPTTTKERIMGRAANRHSHLIVRIDHETRDPLCAPLEEALISGLIQLFSRGRPVPETIGNREAQPSVEAASCRFDAQPDVGCVKPLLGADAPAFEAPGTTGSNGERSTDSPIANAQLDVGCVKPLLGADAPAFEIASTGV